MSSSLPPSDSKSIISALKKGPVAAPVQSQQSPKGLKSMASTAETPVWGNGTPGTAGATSSTQETPAAQRVQTSFKDLAQAAVGLNAASDELGKAITELDASLRKLNVGVSAWVQLSGNDGMAQGQDWWWSRDLGYARVRDRWGIALRTSSGEGRAEESEQWLFNDAPRWMRTEAIGKIPDLLDALVKQARDSAKLIEKKTVEARAFASAISALAEKE